MISMTGVCSDFMFWDFCEIMDTLPIGKMISVNLTMRCHMLGRGSHAIICLKSRVLYLLVY